MPTGNAENFEPWIQELSQCLARIPGLEGAPQLSRLVPAKWNADDVAKVLVSNGRGDRLAVLLIASEGAPEMVLRGMDAARAAKAALGPSLGEVVLDPLAEGRRGGRTYAVLPYHPPLASGRVAWRLQRRGVRSAVLQWLLAATRHTARPATPAEAEANFVTPLEHLRDLPGVPDPLARAAAACLERIAAQAWAPHHVLMHNDLWKGNVLQASNRHGFVLIDWPGARVDGYGVYDVLRLSGGVGLKGSKLRDVVVEHCQVLSCEAADARSHLISGLAELSTRLEHYPLASFASMAQRSLEALEALGL